MPGNRGGCDHREMPTNEVQYRVTTCGRWAQQNDPVKTLRRVQADVGDALVHGEKCSTLRANVCEECGVVAAGKALVGDGVGVVAEGAELGGDLNGKVFVEFEFHSPETGSRLSSRASSAA